MALRVGVCDLTDCGGDQHGARLPEAWRVCERECLKAELHPQALLQPKLLVRRKVPVEKAALPENISSRAAERELRRRLENVNVEVFRNASGESRIWIAHNVGPAHYADC